MIDITQPPYNAPGQGEDDTTILEAAFAATTNPSNTRGGVIYAPVGGYGYGSQLNAPLQPGQSFILRGDGSGGSILKSLASDAGINITFPSGNLAAGRVSAEGLTIKTTIPSGGNGLTLTSTNAPNPGPEKNLEKLTFCGVNGGYWTNALVLDGCTFADINKLKVNGLETNGVLSGNGLVIQNSQTTHAVDYHINDMFAWEVNQALTIGIGVEGVYLNTFTFEPCKEGIRWMNGSNPGLPLLETVNGHINCQEYGVLTQDVVQQTHTNLVIYRNLDNGLQPWTAIFVDNNVSSGTEDANEYNAPIIRGFGNPSNTNGIVFRNCCYSTISAPEIDNVQTPIWFQPGSNYNTVIRPKMTNCLSGILDQGIGNVII